MLTKYILGGLSVVFIALALIRMASPGARPQSRIFLLIGAIFGVVSAWLFSQG
jgi:hypothetical protein